jgi:hypothetical protein
VSTKRLLAIAEAIKAEAGVVKHHVLAKPKREDGWHQWGWSFPKRGIIHAPAGHTDRELYTLAHECAHVALRHDHRKPLWRREYEAEQWAHAALRRHGVAVPEDDTINAMMSVFFMIEEANERGWFGRPKRIAAEAAEWSGWTPDQALDLLDDAVTAHKPISR